MRIDETGDHESPTQIDGDCVARCVRAGQKLTPTRHSQDLVTR